LCLSLRMVSCQLPLKMAEEIAFENGWISNFEGLVTLTLDRVILHTVMHHSSTFTSCQMLLKSMTSVLDRWTYGWMDGHLDGHLRLALLGPLCRKVDLKGCVYAECMKEGNPCANMFYLREVLSVKQLTYEDNAVTGISKNVQLITFCYDADAMWEWNTIAYNKCKRLQLNAMVET